MLFEMNPRSKLNITKIALLLREDLRQVKRNRVALISGVGNFWDNGEGV